MNRNVESRFALNPTRLDMSRSRFNISSSHKTTFEVGKLIPFWIEEVLPGDTFNVKTSKVVRLQTLITPMMDNLYLDTYFFFVPNRLVWEHWKNFCGESDQAWTPSVEYTIPQLTAPDAGWHDHTIADYMGIPTEVSGISVNALPFRGFARIYDEWFRDENLQDPIFYPITDTTYQGHNSASLIYMHTGGYPPNVNKYHDYFTSCLPAPQKGPDTTIPFINYADPWPVVTREDIVPKDYQLWDSFTTGSSNKSIWPIQYHKGTETNYGGGTNNPFSMSVGSGSLSNADAKYDSVGSKDPASAAGSAGYWAAPVNLWSIPRSGNFEVTINQLRIAFQIQKFYERNARGGTRYIEILKSHFGVTSPDSRLQRTEYLGGNRIPIRINQVIQQSSTDSTSPQGSVTGMSLTTDNHSDFTRSFTEHGFVIGVMCARYDHTYQQGIERFWSRKDKFDFYWPVFANLGEMAVLNKEIYAQGTSQDEEIFGFQECWADYKYKPNRVSAAMRSNYSTSLDVWHLADDYSTLPTLSPTWMAEDGATVDRVLAVGQTEDQLFADIYVQCTATRPMPMYSIPGLIDHH